MLKRPITYEGFDGETVTDTLYFNLTKTELVELQVSYAEGLEGTINRIIEARDIKSVIEEFKKIVLMAYGVRSEDGKRFIKSDQLREEFTQTAAYDALFIELATNEDAAVTFIRGIVPRDVLVDLNETAVVDTPPIPPSAS